MRRDLFEMVEEEESGRPVGFRETIQDAEHELGITCGIVWQADGQAVRQHIEQAFRE